MRIIDRIKLNTVYRDLKQYNLSNSFLEKVFGSQYKQTIKPFLSSLQNYKNSFGESIPIDKDTVLSHTKAILEMSINDNARKYSTFVTNNALENSEINQFELVGKEGFDAVFNLFGMNLFSRKNICEIVDSGFGNRFVQFYNEHLQGKSNLIDNLGLDLFKDGVWEVVLQNTPIGDTRLIDVFNNKLNVLPQVISSGFVEGIKYSFENIPNSRQFILGGSFQNTAQFSMNFINNVGNKCLSTMYKGNYFYDKHQVDSLMAVASTGNFQLIKDCVTYDPAFKFDVLNPEDYQKSFLENSKYFTYSDHKSMLISKFLGVKHRETEFATLVVNAIKGIKEIPQDFNDKYGKLFTSLNQIFNAKSDDEILELGKTLDFSNQDENNTLFKELEKDGNNLIRDDFAKDIKIASEKIETACDFKEIETENGNKVKIYNLKGEPFTLLIHNIVNNKAGENNDIGQEILKDPTKWTNLDGPSKHVSTSLITEKYMMTYGLPMITLGFNNFKGNNVRLMATDDLGIERNIEHVFEDTMRVRTGGFSRGITENTVETVESIMEKTISNHSKDDPRWNEILMARENLNPDYIVCYNSTNPDSIRFAETLGIPIYLIDRDAYPEAIGNVIKNKVNQDKEFKSDEECVIPHIQLEESQMIQN